MHEIVPTSTPGLVATSACGEPCAPRCTRVRTAPLERSRTQISPCTANREMSDRDFVGSTPNTSNLFHQFLSLFVSNKSNNPTILMTAWGRCKAELNIFIVYSYDAFGAVKERVQKTDRAIRS